MIRSFYKISIKNIAQCKYFSPKPKPQTLNAGCVGWHLPMHGWFKPKAWSSHSDPNLAPRAQVVPSQTHFGNA